MQELCNKKYDDNLGASMNKTLMMVAVVLSLFAAVKFLPPNFLNSREYVRNLITKAVIEINVNKLNIDSIEYIPNHKLPKEENWDAGAYRVVSSLEDSDVKFVNYVDSNIIYDPYVKKSANLSGYADQLKVADHSFTDREIILLKEYSKLCNLPVEDFSYDGTEYETGVGDWSVWPESGPGYHFYFENEHFRYLRKGNN